jgi:hypothetical protein
MDVLATLVTPATIIALATSIAFACALALGLALLLAKPPTAAVARLTGVIDDDPTDEDDSGDAFLFDLAARFNESVMQNIDATATVLIAVLGITTAFAVLAVDKINELDCGYESWALRLLIGAGAVSAAGFALYGLGRPRDGIRPSRFIAAYTQNPAEAVADATLELARKADSNVRTRFYLRALAMAAVALFLAGALMVGLARWAGATTACANVVRSAS